MYNQATMDLLLTTKLHIPPTGPSLLPRRRLVARIDEGLRQSGPGGGFARKLTLLSAPAGFGKTTLLSEWAAVSPLVARNGSPADLAAPKTSDSSRITTRVAWLSLDEADNDPVRFLSYLIAALQTAEPDLGRDLLPILQSPGLNPNPDSLPANQSVLQPLSLPLEELLTSLINQVQALAGRGLVLVLDDYHLVSARIVHRALAFLLEYLPGNLHLVIATRAEPSLPLARLRGRGQLTEIRQGDLSFSPEEVAELLNQVMGLSLSNHEVAALTSQTEGWAAGLQMACLALRATLARSDGTAGDFDSFIQAFSGTDRYVLDYLAEEVLRNLPEEIQTFLLRSSILDRFCAPLCDAIVEHAAEGGPHQISRASSQQIIEQLEAENLFVISLDAERAWYRYHRLFADLLRRRLRWRVGAEDRKLLHRRASLWFEQQGSLPEAIDHALEGEDFERAAALVERVAEATLMRSEVTTYLGWVERLPEEVERKRPALCLLHAWALLLGGRSLEAVESQLQEAGEGAALSAGQEMPLRAFVATLQGQIPRAARLSRQALVQLPEDKVFLRGIATYTLGVAYLLGGDVEAAVQALDEAAWANESAGNVMVAVMALCSLAELYAALAQLRRAEETYRRALDLATGEYGQPLPIAGMALIGLGELNREWNNLEAATGYLVEGIERAKAWTELGASDGCLALARVKQAQGDDGGAQEMMRQAQELAARAGISHFSDAILEAYQAWLWICQGNLAAAERWTAGKGLAPSLLEGVRVEAGEPWDDLLDIKEGGLSVDYHLRKYEHLVWARLLLAQNRPGQALAVVDPFLAAMDQVGGRGSAKAIELLILRALSLQGLGDIANALETLAGALSLAEPGGYVRLFLDEGEPMARLLRTAADRNIEPKYVERLLSAHESGSSAQAPISIPSPEPIVRRPSSVGQRPSLPLVEPLTEREQEVLGLLATHLNSTEIAGQLCISPHTVRYHIKSIYGKLGVHRRTEAVERARDLDLL